MIARVAQSEWPITIPESAHTLDGFRAWVMSESFPPRGEIEFLDGEIYIDLSREKIQSHNQVKAEVQQAVSQIVKQLDLGDFFPNGAWLTNDEARLSVEADATFVTWESLRTRRARFVPSQDGDDDSIEMQGSPDWVLEVVSDSSVRKDTKRLPQLYHRAGIREYWLIDARGEDVLFTINHHEQAGYVAANDDDGWQTSRVFGRQFRLDRKRDPVGGWQYTLHVRDIAAT